MPNLANLKTFHPLYMWANIKLEPVTRISRRHVVTVIKKDTMPMIVLISTDHHIIT